MDFFLKNLVEVIEVINKLMRKSNIITVKKIRLEKKIESSNRSKINFLWRSLEFLVSEGILETTSITSPKKYIIKPSGKIEINEILSQCNMKGRS